MIDEFDKLNIGIDPPIVDGEVTETISNCSNSNNERCDPTKQKDDGNLRHLINLILV